MSASLSVLSKNASHNSLIPAITPRNTSKPASIQQNRNAVTREPRRSTRFASSHGRAAVDSALHALLDVRGQTAQVGSLIANHVHRPLSRPAAIHFTSPARNIGGIQ